MKGKSLLADYCDNRVLSLPSGLYGMKDVSPFLVTPGGGFFLKRLQRSLVNIEFKSDMPLFVYMVHGKEVLTLADNEVIELSEGEGVLVPAGINIFSDFHFSEAENPFLTAFLVFLEKDAFEPLLFSCKGLIINNSKPSDSQAKPIKINKDYYKDVLSDFFEYVYNNRHFYQNDEGMIHLKERELVKLLVQKIELEKIYSTLWHGGSDKSKRNLARLMEQNFLVQASISQFAAISGRSVATFNRDFKKIFGCSAKQWLIGRRLDYSYQLLTVEGSNVTEAAQEIGYENVSHFIKVFKAKYGVTPAQIEAK